MLKIINYVLEPHLEPHHIKKSYFSTLFLALLIDYNNCISKKKINESRLKKLSKVNTKELLIIKELLKQNKYSTYQENNKERILNFIVRNNKND